MSENVAQLIYDGAVAVRSGDKARARDLLMRAIELDEHNEQAWLWLSGAVEDPEDQIVALENVLSINPSNVAAKKGLNHLKQQRGWS